MVRKSLFARLFGLSKSSTETLPPRGRRTTPTEPSARMGGTVKNGAGATADRPQQGASAASQKDATKEPDVAAVKVERVETASGESKERPLKDVKPAKLGPQEEITLKINEGIDTLSGLLVKIDGKLAEQNRHRELLARRLEKLPEVLETVARTQKDNLEATREVGKAVSAQSEALQGTAQSLQKVPEAVDGLGVKLDEHAKAGSLVKESVETVGRSVRSLADGTQRAQNTLLAEFRRAQDEHRRRLEELVDRERRVYYTVAVLGLAVVISLIVVITRMQG